VALPQTLLGKLTALPQTPYLDLLLTEGEGERMEWMEGPLYFFLRISTRCVLMLPLPVQTDTQSIDYSPVYAFVQWRSAPFTYSEL